MPDVIENQEKNVSLEDLAHKDRFEHLLTEPITERQNRLIAKLTKNAELKYSNASLETLDWEARGINKDMIVNLASMGRGSAATAAMPFVTMLYMVFWGGSQDRELY